MDVYSFNIAPQRVVLNVWFTAFRNKSEAQIWLTCDLGHKVAARYRKSGWTLKSRPSDQTSGRRRLHAGIGSLSSSRLSHFSSCQVKGHWRLGKANKVKLVKKSKENYLRTQLNKCSNSVPRRLHLNNLSLLSFRLTEEMSTPPADPLKTFLANVTQSALQWSCMSLSGSQEAWIWQL